MSDSFSIISDLRGKLATANKTIEGLHEASGAYLAGSLAIAGQIEEKLRTAKKRIAELEAQLAETWQPVEDWFEYQEPGDEYKPSVLIEYRDNGAWMSHDTYNNYIHLPDDLRLCRKVAKPTL